MRFIKNTCSVIHKTLETMKIFLVGVLKVIVDVILWVVSHVCMRLGQIMYSKDIIPILHSKDSGLTKYLIRKCRLLNRPFRPPYFLRNRYIQTIVGYFFKPTAGARFEREYIQMFDKGVIALDWYLNNTQKIRRNSPVVVLFPRLTGDAMSVANICKLFSSKSCRTVVINRRGHGNSFLTTPKLTSAGDPSDAKQALDYIFYNNPDVPIVGIGFGAGCATLFSYLGEFGSSSVLKAAVCITPSYDNTEKLCEQIPVFYELLVLINLKKMLLRYAKALHKIIDTKAAILKSWTLKDFDFHVYCKMNGIATFGAFWRKNDPMRDVDDIAIPVLCVNSTDDPVSTVDNIPFDLFNFYPNMLLVTLNKGGHVAFHERLHGCSWAEDLTVHFVESVLEFIANSKYWYK